jgi:hypothetical protein
LELEARPRGSSCRPTSPASATSASVLAIPATILTTLITHTFLTIHAPRRWLVLRLLLQVARRQTASLPPPGARESLAVWATQSALAASAGPQTSRWILLNLTTAPCPLAPSFPPASPYSLPTGLTFLRLPSLPLESDVHPRTAFYSYLTSKFSLQNRLVTSSRHRSHPRHLSRLERAIAVERSIIPQTVGSTQRSGL